MKVTSKVIYIVGCLLNEITSFAVGYIPWISWLSVPVVQVKEPFATALVRSIEAYGDRIDMAEV